MFCHLFCLINFWQIYLDLEILTPKWSILPAFTSTNYFCNKLETILTNSSLKFTAVCISAGPHTWSPGTGPVLPSSPWPVTPRRHARPTCTAASFRSCTLNHPMMCGQRTLTCALTLPWKWVRVRAGSCAAGTGSGQDVSTLDIRFNIAF